MQNSETVITDAVESISETIPSNKTVIIAAIAVTTGVVVTIAVSKLQVKVKAKLAERRAAKALADAE